MEEKEKWYNPQKMLSYNQFVNLIIGERGKGKNERKRKMVQSPKNEREQNDK